MAIPTLKVECEGCGNVYRPENWSDLYGVASVWSLRNPGKIFKAPVRGPKGEVMCPVCYPKELEKDMSKLDSKISEEEYEHTTGDDIEVILGDTSLPKMTYLSNYIKAIDFEIESKKGPYEYDVFLEDLKSSIRTTLVNPPKIYE